MPGNQARLRQKSGAGAPDFPRPIVTLKGLPPANDLDGILDKIKPIVDIDVGDLPATGRDASTGAAAADPVRRHTAVPWLDLATEHDPEFLHPFDAEQLTVVQRDLDAAVGQMDRFLAALDQGRTPAVRALLRHYFGGRDDDATMARFLDVSRRTREALGAVRDAKHLNLSDRKLRSGGHGGVLEMLLNAMGVGPPADAVARHTTTTDPDTGKVTVVAFPIELCGGLHGYFARSDTVRPLILIHEASHLAGTGDAAYDWETNFLRITADAALGNADTVAEAAGAARENGDLVLPLKVPVSATYAAGVATSPLGPALHFAVGMDVELYHPSLHLIHPLLRVAHNAVRGKIVETSGATNWTPDVAAQSLQVGVQLGDHRSPGGNPFVRVQGGPAWILDRGLGAMAGASVGYESRMFGVRLDVEHLFGGHGAAEHFTAASLDLSIPLVIF